MDGELIKALGTKALLLGLGVLLLFWTFNAIKLIISARGINPLVKQFFNQIASGRIDAAYLLTSKGYRQHVNRQDFLKFLGSLNLNRYRNLKSGRPRIEDKQIIGQSDGASITPTDMAIFQSEEDSAILNSLNNTDINDFLKNSPSLEILVEKFQKNLAKTA